MYGIILLEAASIIIFIYKHTKENQLIVLNTNFYDLAHLETIDAAQIVAVLISLFLSHKSFIRKWQLVSRGVSEDIVTDVAKTLDVSHETLTHQREQELICKAVVNEMIG
jgi:hypothetical protein